MEILTPAGKKIRSIALIVVIALLALSGLVLLMSALSAPDTPVAASNPVIQPTSAQDASPPESAAETPVQDIDDTVATVNGQTISRQTWRQATRLDAVMSELSSQPLPTAEETLDRLINEMLVLDQVGDVAAPDEPEVADKISALATAWNVTEPAIDAALSEANLGRGDLSKRVARLMQVETALRQLAAQEDDLNVWLAQTRAAAEIGLYRTLASSGAATQAAFTHSPEQSAAPPDSAESAPEAKNVFAPPPELPSAPYPNNTAPLFTLERLGGGSLALGDFRGRPVIINFWASWCPPCRRELPALQAAYEAHRDEIGFVAVDVKEPPETVAAFVDELGLTFPVALDPDGQVSNVAYEVRGLPTTVFVDAYGVVAARHIGPLDEATIENYLAPLLSPPAGTDVQPAADAGAVEAAGDLFTIPGPTADLPPAPDFSLVSATGETISLQDYRNRQNLVLVFYRGYT